MDAAVKKAISINKIFPGGATHKLHEVEQNKYLQGFHCATENIQALRKKVFWICWLIVGFSSTAFVMSRFFQAGKWQGNSLKTSVATTNLPVSQINFPAVTICTVNKAVPEKLIIQGCLRNKTFSQMRQIISSLVDSESRSNVDEDEEDFKYDPKEALKLIRLVAPKCSDFILQCELDGRQKNCKRLFKLVLTDTGYCCTFNAVGINDDVINSLNDSDIEEHERDYNRMKEIIWNHSHEHQKKWRSGDTHANILSSSDSKTCSSKFTDELIKDQNLCRKLEDCRRNRDKCGIKKWNTKFNHIPKANLFQAEGAGIARGLTVLTDILRCAEVPTDSFVGLRVSIHSPDEFPSVKGFPVGPAQEAQIGVTAINTYLRGNLRNMDISNRMCRFANEFPMKYFDEYSQSRCVAQCEQENIQRWCKCIPFHSPAAFDPNIGIDVCSKGKIMKCMKNRNSFEDVQILRGSIEPVPSYKKKSVFSFGPPEKDDENLGTCANQCLPACNETIYHFEVTGAQFPNQNEPNKTRILKEAIDAGYEYLSDINYVRDSISLLRVFFRDSKIIQYRRDQIFAEEEFLFNFAGITTVCFGFSLLALRMVEAVCSWCMRATNEMMQYYREQKLSVSY